MRPLTSQGLAGSAYRTLGLAASATQAQIDAAARRLRIWPDANSVPPTPWDSPWLGPVRRTRNDIEQAVAALNEPATRVEERLLWFHHPDPSRWAGKDSRALDSTLRALAAANDPASTHDFALARLQLALLDDPMFLQSERWVRQIRRLGALGASDDYLSWALAAEEGGDFEKRAQIEEISAAINALPQSLAASMAARAEESLENDDLPTATQILGMLRVADGDLLAAADCEKRILDRLEDLASRRCDQLHENLNAKFRKAGTPLPIAQAACGGAARLYNESIDPVLALVHQLAGSDSDRTQRARTAAASAMEHMGRAWAACYRYPIAIQTLDAALQLGAGTPIEIVIRNSLQRVRENSRRSTGKASRAGTGRQSTSRFAFTGGGSGSGMARGSLWVLTIIGFSG